MAGSSAQAFSQSRRDRTEEPREPPAPRPLLWPATAFMAGLWLSETLGALAGALWWLALLLPPVALALALVVNRTRRRAIATALLLAAAGGVGLVRHQAAIHRPADHVTHLLEREPLLTRLAGEIVSTPVCYPAEKRNPFMPFDPPAQTRFVLVARELHTTDPPTPIRGRLRVTVNADGLGLRLGDCVELTGRLHPPRPPQNPGEFDWARHHYLQGLDAVLTAKGAPYVRRLPAAGQPWRRLVAAVRGVAHTLLLEPYAHLGPAADGPHAPAGEVDQATRLLQTMVLGQRGAADRKLNEAFLRAGGLHFLAVSGFHVGVLAAVTWWLARRAFKRATLAPLAVLAVVLLYALVAEPNAPILRASVLAGLAALAVLTRRPFSSLNWLALAALCILTYNPLELFRGGFQLSFVQVFALLTVVPRVYRAVSRRHNEPPAEAATLRQFLLRRAGLWLLMLVLISVVAWLTSLPLVWFHFGRFAPWGAAGTLLLTVPVTVTIWLSFLTMLTGLVLSPAREVFGTALIWVTDLVLKLVGLFEHVPLAVVELSPPPGWLVLATYLAALLLLAGRQGVRSLHLVGANQTAPHAAGGLLHLIPTTWKRIAPLAGVMLAWVGWWCWPQSDQRACCLHVLSVSNGSAALLITGDGHAALFDVGTDRNLDAGELVARACRVLDVARLEGVAISHADFDHYSGVPTLMRRVAVRRLWINPYFERQRDSRPAIRRFFELLPADAPPARTLAAGDHFDLGKVGVEVLWPPTDLNPAIWDANDRSLVLRMHAAGRTILLTGDVETAAMRALLEAEAAGQVRLAADVLIAPHHGSAVPGNTAAFYAAVNPEVVVVSAAEARPRLVELVRQTLGADCRVLNTAELGAICVCIMPNGELRVETPFAER